MTVGQPVQLSGRVTAEHPLTRTQSQIWASQRLAAGVPLANMAMMHRISGPLDADRFVAAFDRVARAVEILRTVIVDRPGSVPTARTLASPPSTTMIAEFPAADIAAWSAERISRAIDASRCCYDSVLIRHDDDDWSWWLDLHHVVTDAWSSALLFRVVGETYAELGRAEEAHDGPSAIDRLTPFYPLDAAPPDTPDEQHATRTEFWEANRESDPTTIAPYGPRPARTTHVTRHSVAVDAGALDLQQAAYRTLSPQLSLLGLLATSAAVVLHRLDGRSTFTFGIPLHHRSGVTAGQLVGPLMELYPLRIEVSPDDTFEGLAARVNRGMIDVLRNGRPGEGPDSQFDAVVNVLTATYGDFAGLPATTDWVRSGHVDAAHPIRVQAFDHGTGWEIELDLNDGLSTDGSHFALPEHFARTIATASQTPSTGIGGFDVATTRDAAANALLNATPPSVGDPRCVHLEIAQRLRRDPDLVVAEHDGAELYAAELDARADSFAAWLVGCGVGRGSRVGVRLPRSFDLLVAVHGILRSGAAFVLLDPADPPNRHQVIENDAALAMMIEALPALDAVCEFAAPDVELDDLAYMLYTSGSTGVPKGVPIPHRGLAEYLAGALEDYDPARSGGPAMVMPLHSSVAFDLTITSLFLPQLAGGRTVIADGSAFDALSQVAGDRRVNVLKATPSQLELLSRMIEEPLDLRVVIVGGEAFRRPVAEAFARLCHPDVRIINEYGPTEAVVGCMVHEWDPSNDRGSDVPIGRASVGAEVFVLDRYQRTTPAGSWGELYVRRRGMASGYLNLAEESAHRFVTIESIGGGPVYRTGDRVRIDGDVLVFGGRVDEQMKVGGVRIEPSEIESALVAHDGVVGAVVRLWSPGLGQATRCLRCGLGDDVGDVSIDDAGICSVCRDFDRIEPQTRDWFRTTDDLDRIRQSARRRSSGDIDAILLLSGGKDSTYALYQLVEQGWRIHALTLDNGFISEGAKANIRRSVADLGISHEFMTTDAMNAIFRDSLERYSNVCNGCYKTIYTMATARAHALRVPVIVTGLSRGQFFETRLVPHQFESGRFDPDEIDRTVLQARRAYHRTSDAVTELLPEHALFERTDIDVLDEIEFVDFYRYVDVDLADVYAYLEARAPWVRPKDTGRSTNCLVNVAGIHVHQFERGHHNYAAPYSWDVRLGHKTREEALDELDDQFDVTDVDRMLDEIGYTPRRPEVLTAWYRTTDGDPIDPRVLAAHLREILPARSVPTAFVHVNDLPLAGSAKLDVAGLPAPGRGHTGSATYVEPTTPTEAVVADLWARILEVSPVGIDDDFFDLGGASLSALETVAATERRFSIALPDALVFEHRVLRDFASAVDRRIAGGDVIQVIPSVGDEPHLSLGEEAMLFEHRSDPTDTRYNVTRLYRIDGPVDAERLHAAFTTVVERHGPLHSAPMRNVAAAQATRRIPVEAALSFEALPPGSPDDFAEAQRRVPFDLAAGPLVRVHVGETDPGVWHVLVALHHISIDAGTFDTLWTEVDASYHGNGLPELPVSYAAHGAWQRSRIDASAEFWSRELDRFDEIEGVRLPPPIGPEPDGYLEMPAQVSTTELSTAATTTPFATALAAAAVVLRGYSRSNVVELGITASTKDHPSAEPLIGYFLNTLPLAIDVDRDALLIELDAQAGDLVAAMLPHRLYPLARLVRDARSAHQRVPSITHMLAYEKLTPPRFGDAPTDHRILASGTAVGDLTFFVQERGDALQLGVEYRGAVVSAADARQLLTTFDRTLAAMCRQPHLSVDRVLSVDAEPDLVGPALETTPSTVVHRILDTAARHGDRPAVIDAKGAVTTYSNLVDRGMTLAQALLATGRPGRVGIALGRSNALLEAIVGVHLAGAAYVPIDPATPPARRDAMARDAALDVVIVDQSSAKWFDQVPCLDITARFDVESSGSSIDGSRRAPIEPPSPDAAAYVIFTSGSTGGAAGVEVTHAALDASTTARSSFYGSAAPQRFLLTPSIGFDSSMVGIFWPLTTGGTVVVPGDDDVHDVDRLGALIDDLDVSHLLMVPSLYRALLDRRPAMLSRLKMVIVAGEACPPALVADHIDRLGAVELVNEYGPTEATVWASAHRCALDDDPVPIGGPIAGSVLRVADRHRRPVGRGGAGELLISGPGVVSGYLSGRSDDAFVEVDERRWYCTGDLVQVDRAGRLVFLGRVDDQLNVGGLRIEPAEIEAVLTGIDGIDEAVVVEASIGGRRSLVAHLVGDADRVNRGAIRATLTERLPVGAVPRHFVVHETLARTMNGKIDRSAAARLAVGEPTRSDAPVGVDAVVEIWRRVLGQNDLDADADFFESGGDSIAAVEIVTAVGDLVGREVSVSVLLDAPTPRAIANVIELAAPRAAGSTISMVNLRRGAVRGPAVVLVAGWYDVLSYRELADALPAHVAVSALVVPKSLDGPPTIRTVDQLADASIDVVRAWIAERAPSGFALAGWSIGGVVAYEIGQRLAADGVDVDAIGLIDTYFPGEHRHTWSNRWWTYKSLLQVSSVSALFREFGMTGRRRVKRYVAVLARRLLMWSGESVERPVVVTDAAGVPASALDHHLRPGRAPVVMYGATTTNPQRTERPWRSVAPDLRLVSVAGRHRGPGSIMATGRVHHIADDLSAVVSRGWMP